MVEDSARPDGAVQKATN